MKRFSQFLVAQILLVIPALMANEASYRTLQSGSPSGQTPLSDRGIHGEGEIISVLDTGVDADSCYFAEPDNSLPPLNIGVQSFEVDLGRRKIIAYDMLYECGATSNAPGCDDLSRTDAYDNFGHGTHAAGSAVGDSRTPVEHDYADAIASGARLVVQDTGFRPQGDACTQLPGLGCPVRDLRPIFLQAWVQGARIHSNSWGDRQSAPPFPGVVPPTANYPMSAFYVDDFADSHPDTLIVFNSGNAGQLGPSSISAPGAAKNTIQVGGTRYPRFDDTVISAMSGTGPTRDGRIKPDLVGPAFVVAGDSDFDITTRNCNVSIQGGTSWASPTIAGAAALVRQYYREGFYPGGARTSSDRIEPSAALVKATLLAAGRRVPFREIGGELVVSEPLPSYEQGFGFPVLDDALFFLGDRERLFAVDRSREAGLSEGETFRKRIEARGGGLKVLLVWTDRAGTPSGPTDATPQLVNDLDLVVRLPGGGLAHGNERLHPGQRDRLNNVEGVLFEAAAAGSYEIVVSAHELRRAGPQSFALVVVGDFTEATTRRRPVRR